MESQLGDSLEGPLGRAPRSPDRLQVEAEAQQEASDARANTEEDASDARSGIQELLDFVNETRRIIPPE